MSEKQRVLLIDNPNAAKSFFAALIARNSGRDIRTLVDDEIIPLFADIDFTHQREPLLQEIAAGGFAGMELIPDAFAHTGGLAQTTQVLAKISDETLSIINAAATKRFRKNAKRLAHR